jgi:hypothetical protein
VIYTRQKSILHVHQYFRTSCQQLNNIAIGWLKNIDYIGKNNAPLIEIGAIMRGPKKTKSQGADLNVSKIREATLSRDV